MNCMLIYYNKILFYSLLVPHQVLCVSPETKNGTRVKSKISYFPQWLKEEFQNQSAHSGNGKFCFGNK